MQKEGTKTAQRGASKAAGRQDWIEFDSRAFQTKEQVEKLSLPENDDFVSLFPRASPAM